MAKEKYAIDFVDIKGKRTVWNQASYKEHAKRHPELNASYYPTKIKDAKNDPVVIMKSYTDKDCLCYYYFEFALNNKPRYTKLVVDTSDPRKHKIRTSFTINKIQELKYSKPIWTKPGYETKK